MHLRLGFCLLVWQTAVPAGELTVKNDFPGGAARIEKIDQKERLVRLAPSGDPERGWPAWWYLKVEGIEKGETILLDVGGGQKGGWATPDRAAVSLDNRTWAQTDPGVRNADRIVYRVKIDATEAWFAWGPPFVLAQAEEMIRAASTVGGKHVTRFELCKSKAGHSVPALHIRYPGVDDADRITIWVQARQHAWESGGSWVARGFVEWLLSEDPRADTLRKKAEFYIVPIMDADNVETGNGGKNQKPQDHNRDWSAAPSWPEVKAAQEWIRKLNTEGRFALFVDLHNPAPGDRRPYFYLPPPMLLGSGVALRNQTAFIDGVRTEMVGPLKLGAERTSGPEYDKNWEKISKNWVKKNSTDPVVAVTLETAWNTPDSTTSGYRTVGKQLGLGIERASREWKRR